MENDLFQDTKQVTNIEDVDHNNLQITNYLETLVGEGKKFKTVDDLARGKVESDKFIDQLKNELKTLREQAAQSKKVEDILSRLDTRTNQDDNRDHSDVIDRNNPNEYNQTQERTPAKPEFDIDKLIEQKLSQRDSQQIQKSNIDTVLKTLYESFGDNYVDVTKQRLNELGLTGQEFREYAAKNPKAALRLVNSNSTERVQPNTPPNSRVNMNTQSSNKRNWNYYENLRKTQPNVYKSDQIQMQMHNDAIQAGEAFYNT